jgi:hypothetical protein
MATQAVILLQITMRLIVGEEEEALLEAVFLKVKFSVPQRQSVIGMLAPICAEDTRITALR